VLVGAVGLVVLVVGAVAWVVAPLLPVVLGNGFRPAVPIFRVLLLSLPGLVMATMIVPQWVARGHFAALAATSVTFGVMQLALLWIVVPRGGSLGAAWATVAVYGIAFLIQTGMAIYCERDWRLALAPA
jgi:O-antigen/teichoic acid export membrane protein